MKYGKNVPFFFSFLFVSHSVAPDVELKGESAIYLLLVQGSDDVGRAACRVRMLHSDTQMNGAAAMATVSGLLRQKSLSSSGMLCGYVSVEIFLCCIEVSLMLSVWIPWEHLEAVSGLLS